MNHVFQCHVFPGRDHSTIMSRIEEPDDAVADTMLRFIQTHTRREPSSSAAVVPSTR